ncbi:hypothetical protein HD597_003358 [Nonomuraea thailandensis]|uniref:Uncharacterized protein n=1 Tax=Nonomuraea thailandensis TaxID=1188745 RepID=A0A9X2GLC6_9ACTN|nr:DUF6348 family protein [Nonomuraea thailandensis]MCP2356338.1 hypothetical protein [Nonomuraea thailandensis]
MAGGERRSLGTQLNLFADRPVPSAGSPLDRLLQALRAEPLTRRVHGLRLFTSHHDGRLQINEVLLDSEPWPGGEAVVADSPAPLPDGRVAVRIFGPAGACRGRVVLGDLTAS